MSNFSAIFRTRTFKNLSATGLETRKGDGYGRIILPVQQVSYGPLIMSIMLIMSCYTGFFNVRRGRQSLNTGPRFYLRLIRRTGWLWISTSRTTDFYTPGFPRGWNTLRDICNTSRWVMDLSVAILYKKITQKNKELVGLINLIFSLVTLLRWLNLLVYEIRLHRENQLISLSYWQIVWHNYENKD